VIVYFSSVSENTERFVRKLGLPATRIPLLSSGTEHFSVSEPFLLISPTYGASGRGFVPKQVVRFLNTEEHRILCRGVVGSGNVNFAEEYALAGPIIARKLGVPLIHTFELSGMADDVETVRKGYSEIVKTH
jgi:protein involved in ribonucleotide reduction